MTAYMHIAMSNEFRITRNLSPMFPLFRLRKKDREIALEIVPKQQTVLDMDSPIATVFFIFLSSALAVSVDNLVFEIALIYPTNMPNFTTMN